MYSLFLCKLGHFIMLEKLFQNGLAYQRVSKFTPKCLYSIISRSQSHKTIFALILLPFCKLGHFINVDIFSQSSEKV